MMREQLKAIREEAIKQIQDSGNLDKLNDVRVAFLGKKGQLTAVLKGMKDVAPEERPVVGQLVNDTRASIEKALEETKEEAGGKSQGRADEERGHRCDSPGQEESMWVIVIPTLSRWKRLSGFSSAWAMRLWRARRWSMTFTTLRN